MTANPLPPTHLLTTAEYAALGEDEHGRTELMEGNLVMSPGRTPNHNVAGYRLAVQIEPQLPPQFEVILGIDVDLELAPADQPGTARRPDLIVARRSARERVTAEGGLIRASEVVVVAEVVSPGSRRIDRIVKRAEYADAGIPHYWIIDLESPVSLLASHLAEGSGHRDEPVVTGTYATDEPFSIRLELDQLG